MVVSELSGLETARSQISIPWLEGFTQRGNVALLEQSSESFSEQNGVIDSALFFKARKPFKCLKRYPKLGLKEQFTENKYLRCFELTAGWLWDYHGV
jgi:hypothetical protein